MRTKSEPAVSLFLNAPCRKVSFVEVIPGVKVPVVEHYSDSECMSVGHKTLFTVFTLGYKTWLAAHWSLPSTFGAKRGANV